MRRSVKIDVDIPAGIADRQAINKRGDGSKGTNGGPAGDLRIGVNVRPHPFFERDGYNVWYEATISFAQAALGAELTVPTLDGNVKYSIPSGTQPGDVFKLKERGIPSLSGRGRGDQLVRVVVEVPKKLNERQKELLRQYAEACGETDLGSGNERGGIFGKKKK